MAEIWRILQDGVVTGPFLTDEVAAAVASGEVALTASVWREGMRDWEAIGRRFPVGRRRRKAPARARPGEVALLAAGTALGWLGATGLAGFLYLHWSTLCEPEDLLAAWIAVGVVSLVGLLMAATLWWRAAQRLALRSPEFGAAIRIAVVLLSLPLAAASALELEQTGAAADLAGAMANLGYSVRYDAAQRTVFYSGAIGARASVAIAPFIGPQGPARRLVLTSRGGLTAEALRMARRIDEAGSITTVTHGQCDSACIPVLLSGRTRLADFDMVLRFHAASSVTGSTDALSNAMLAREQDATDALLEKEGVSHTILAKAERLGPSRTVDVSTIDLAEQGVLSGLVVGSTPLTPAQARARLAADSALPDD